MKWFHRHYYYDGGLPFWVGYFYHLSKYPATHFCKKPDIDFVCAKCEVRFVGYIK